MLTRVDLPPEVEDVVQAAQLVLNGIKLQPEGIITVERLMEMTGYSKLRVIELMEHPAWRSAFQERLHTHTMLSLAKAAKVMDQDLDNENPKVRNGAANVLATIVKTVEPKTPIQDEESAVKAAMAVLERMKRAQAHVVQEEKITNASQKEVG